MRWSFSCTYSFLQLFVKRLLCARNTYNITQLLSVLKMQ